MLHYRRLQVLLSVVQETVDSAITTITWRKGKLPFFIISSLAARVLCPRQRRLLGGSHNEK